VTEKFIHRFFYLIRYFFFSAGCVIANRLTENKKFNVLLIEAGKVETPVQNVPGLAAFQQLTDYNWNYQAEPQPGSCLGLYKNSTIRGIILSKINLQTAGMENQRCNLNRGKALGGSSVINYMMYVRGHR
jgi:choline dehydrogenase-like flavoprotein